MKKTILLPDLHYPLHTQEIYNKILKVIKAEKIKDVVLLGDAQDMSSINHWEKEKGNLRGFEGKRLIKDYMNFDKDILKPLEKLGCNIVYMEGNHECLDEETELLTKRGWIKHDKILINDLVFSYNSSIGSGEWVGIDKIIRKDFNGEMNVISSDVINIKATDDHKLFSIKDNNSKFTKICEITGSRYEIPVCSISNNDDYNILDDEIRLSAWLLTDGSISSNGRLTIYQSKDITKILTILDSLKYKYTISERIVDNIIINGKKVKNSLPQKIINISNRSDVLKYISTKESLPQWVEKLSDRQFMIFLESIIDGDGSRHKSCPESSWMLYGKKNFLEAIQKECILHNISASFSTYRKGEIGEGYRLNISNNRKTYKFEKTEKNFYKENYNGIVWDLTVKNHNFMIKRNGKCHFTGNCWVEDVVDKNPQLEGLIEYYNILDFKKRNIKFIRWIEKNGGRGCYDIGKLRLIHGEYTGQYHAAKTSNSYSKNVVYGHTHDIQSFTKITNDGDIHQAQSIGCLCQLSPGYMKGRPNKWVNGFGVLYTRDDGTFNVYTVIISNNKFTFNDKTY